MKKAVAAQRAVLLLIHLMIPPLAVGQDEKIVQACVNTALIAPGRSYQFRTDDLDTLGEFTVGYKAQALRLHQLAQPVRLTFVAFDLKNDHAALVRTEDRHKREECPGFCALHLVVEGDTQPLLCACAEPFPAVFNQDKRYQGLQMYVAFKFN